MNLTTYSPHLHLSLPLTHTPTQLYLYIFYLGTHGKWFVFILDFSSFERFTLQFAIHTHIHRVHRTTGLLFGGQPLYLSATAAYLLVYQLFCVNSVTALVNQIYFCFKISFWQHVLLTLPSSLQLCRGAAGCRSCCGCGGGGGGADPPLSGLWGRTASLRPGPAVCRSRSLAYHHGESALPHMSFLTYSTAGDISIRRHILLTYYNMLVTLVVMSVILSKKCFYQCLRQNN